MGTAPSWRHRLEFAGLRAATALIRRLPYSSLRRLAWVLGGIVATFDSRGMRVARANLDCVFGDAKTPNEKQRIAKDSYRTFARTMLELFWAPNLKPSDLGTKVLAEGMDQHPCNTDPNTPVIYYCFHYSNFEWLSLVGSYLVGKGFVLTQQFKNPLLGPVFDHLRSATGHEILTQKQAALRMFKHLKKGGKFYMLTDLTLDPRESSVILNCFGKKMCVTKIHAAVGLRTRAFLVPVACIPRPDGGYWFRLQKPLEVEECDDELSLAQKAWDALEPTVLEHPELWIWSYKHLRFRPADAPAEDYPFYANVAPRFDRKLRAQEEARPMPGGNENSDF